MSYKALLFCPDEKTARVVTQVLSELDFQVEPWNEPFAAVKKLTAEHFDAIVVDCDNEQNAALLFKSAKNSGFNQQSLSVAVVEGQSGVAKAFRLGANLVLTKPINVEQAKGTLRVARGLLRKNEGAKHTAAPSGAMAPPATPMVPAPVSIEIKHPVAAKTPAATPAVFAPQPAVTAPAATVFEVEEDPEVKPDLAEAALLESMPDPMAGKKSSLDSPPTAEARRENPWQPLARAAEPVSQAPSIAAPSLGSFGHGAAAAPAPAKEISIDEELSAPSTVEPPSFSSLGGKTEQLDSDGGGSKKILLVAAVIVLAAAGAYFGWTKLHPATGMSSTPAPKAPAPASTQSTLPPQIPTPTPTPAPTTTNTTATTEPAVNKPEQAPDLTLSTADAPASKGKSVAPSSSVATKPTVPPQPRETLVVKSETHQAAPAIATPVEPAPAAPGMFSVGQNSSDKGLSGIVDAPTSSVAQPTASLKLSQGVAQGLLMKRVPPIYPQQARQTRIQGAVELLATIGKDGNITSLKQLSGDQILGRAAIDAVKQWKYRPYLLDGQPVEIQTQITVNFKLP